MRRSLSEFRQRLTTLLPFLIFASVGFADIPKLAEEFPLTLNKDTYATWRDHILPADRELAFQRIPWLTTFKDGILTSNRENKPLLLWTMNGHPLGCT